MLAVIIYLGVINTEQRVLPDSQESMTNELRSDETVFLIECLKADIILLS